MVAMPPALGTRCPCAVMAGLMRSNAGAISSDHIFSFLKDHRQDQDDDADDAQRQPTLLNVRLQSGLVLFVDGLDHALSAPDRLFPVRLPGPQVLAVPLHFVLVVGELLLGQFAILVALLLPLLLVFLALFVGVG